MATNKKKSNEMAPGCPARLPGSVPLPPGECPTSQVLNLIGHRWAVQVLWALNHAARPIRFRELQRALEPITQKEMTNRLRELEAAMMVHRKVYPEVPPRVEYQLTALGKSIIPLLIALADWVRDNGLDLNAQTRKTRTRALRLPRSQ